MVRKSIAHCEKRRQTVRSPRRSSGDESGSRRSSGGSAGSPKRLQHVSTTGKLQRASTRHMAGECGTDIYDGRRSTGKLQRANTRNLAQEFGTDTYDGRRNLVRGIYSEARKAYTCEIEMSDEASEQHDVDESGELSAFSQVVSDGDSPEPSTKPSIYRVKLQASMKAISAGTQKMLTRNTAVKILERLKENSLIEKVDQDKQNQRERMEAQMSAKAEERAARLAQREFDAAARASQKAREELEEIIRILFGRCDATGDASENLIAEMRQSSEYVSQISSILDKLRSFADLGTSDIGDCFACLQGLDVSSAALFLAEHEAYIQRQLQKVREAEGAKNQAAQKREHAETKQQEHKDTAKELKTRTANLRTSLIATLGAVSLKGQSNQNREETINETTPLVEKKTKQVNFASEEDDVSVFVDALLEDVSEEASDAPSNEEDMLSVFSEEEKAPMKLEESENWSGEEESEDKNTAIESAEEETRTQPVDQEPMDDAIFILAECDPIEEDVDTGTDDLTCAAGEAPMTDENFNPGEQFPEESGEMSRADMLCSVSTAGWNKIGRGKIEIRESKFAIPMPQKEKCPDFGKTTSSKHKLPLYMVKFPSNNCIEDIVVKRQNLSFVVPEDKVRPAISGGIPGSARLPRLERFPGDVDWAAVDIVPQLPQLARNPPSSAFGVRIRENAWSDVEADLVQTSLPEKIPVLPLQGKITATLSARKIRSQGISGSSLWKSSLVTIEEPWIATRGELRGACKKWRLHRAHTPVAAVGRK